MQCKQVEKLMGRYKRGLLDSERTYVVKNHLTKCSSCKGRMEKPGYGRLIGLFLLAALLAGVTIFWVIRVVKVKEEGLITRYLDSEKEKKIISNIIIEVFSKDPEGDGKIVKDYSKEFGAKIVSSDPLSIELVKTKVDNFINGLDSILVFPEGTSKRVRDFVKPLNESDIVVIKIKFLPPSQH